MSILENKEILARSNLAKDFLESELWKDYLNPWVDTEKTRLMQNYISLPNTEKFHAKREDMKARFTACSMIGGILNVWKGERQSIERSEEMKKADKKMTESL